MPFNIKKIALRVFLVILLGGIVYILPHLYMEKYFLEERLNNLQENLNLLVSASEKTNILLEENPQEFINIPINKYKYSQIFSEIIKISGDNLLLSSITQEKENLILEGKTINYTILADLASQFLETGYFSNIEIKKATNLANSSSLDFLDVENTLSEISFVISLELRKEEP